MSATPQELIFSEPFDEDGFTASDGAGSIKVDGIIKGIKVFRESLFVFCEDSIFKITGSSLSDFAVVPVTRRIGCVDGFSIQEISGDIVYLAPDGLRTIAGTERIGDVELGTVSKTIQPRLDNIDTDRISSLVIRGKTQYRLFFPADAGAESTQPGIIGVIKSGTEGGIGWEYADIKGIKPACCESGFISGTETILHGGYDGYIYKQESGNTFDGTNISAIYRSPDYTMGDAGIRKLMQRIIWNYENESAVNSKFRIRYDFSSSDVPQPAEYDLTRISNRHLRTCSSNVWHSSVRIIGNTTRTTERRGRGIHSSRTLGRHTRRSPISIKGYQLEFTPGGRR